MAYRFEWVLPGDPVEHTAEYRRAVSLHGGYSFGSRLVDAERGRSLYCAAVNGNEERPPGRYLLFLQSEVVIVDAYCQDEQNADGSKSTTFLVRGWQLPEVLHGRQAMVRDAVIEALEAYGFASELPVAAVTVVGIPEWWQKDD